MNDFKVHLKFKISYLTSGTLFQDMSFIGI